MGGSTGNLDLSKIAELAGNLLQGGDLDLTQITQLLSGLIGGTGGLGGTDIGAIVGIVSGLTKVVILISHKLLNWLVA